MSVEWKDIKTIIPTMAIPIAMLVNIKCPQHQPTLQQLQKTIILQQQRQNQRKAVDQ